MGPRPLGAYILLLKCCRNHVAFDGILEHVVETMSHLTAFWVPLGYLGAALGCPGLFSQICRKLDAQFRANVSILQCLRIKNCLAEFIRGSPGSRGSAQSGARAAVPNPTSRARGQDDVSLEQTPSNELAVYYNHRIE